MSEEIKVQYIWIYEYKNDNTAVGTTFYDGPARNIRHIELPRLRGDWHWRVESRWEYEDELQR